MLALGKRAVHIIQYYVSSLYFSLYIWPLYFRFTSNLHVTLPLYKLFLLTYLLTYLLECLKPNSNVIILLLLCVFILQLAELAISGKVFNFLHSISLFQALMLLQIQDDYAVSQFLCCFMYDM